MRISLSEAALCLLALCTLCGIALSGACAPRGANAQMQLAQGARVVVAPYEDKEQSSTTRTLKHEPEPPKSPTPPEPTETRRCTPGSQLVAPAKQANSPAAQQESTESTRGRQTTGGRSIRNTRDKPRAAGAHTIRDSQTRTERAAPGERVKPNAKPRPAASGMRRSAPARGGRAH